MTGDSYGNINRGCFITSLAENHHYPNPEGCADFQRLPSFREGQRRRWKSQSDSFETVSQKRILKREMLRCTTNDRIYYFLTNQRFTFCYGICLLCHKFTHQNDLNSFVCHGLNFAYPWLLTFFPSGENVCHRCFIEFFSRSKLSAWQAHINLSHQRPNHKLILWKTPSVLFRIYVENKGLITQTKELNFVE